MAAQVQAAEQATVAAEASAPADAPAAVAEPAPAPAPVAEECARARGGRRICARACARGRDRSRARGSRRARARAFAGAGTGACCERGRGVRLWLPAVSALVRRTFGPIASERRTVAPVARSARLRSHRFRTAHRRSRRCHRSARLRSHRFRTAHRRSRSLPSFGAPSLPSLPNGAPSLPLSRRSRPFRTRLALTSAQSPVGSPLHSDRHRHAERAFSLPNPNNTGAFYEHQAPPGCARAHVRTRARHRRDGPPPRTPYPSARDHTADPEHDEPSGDGRVRRRGRLPLERLRVFWARGRGGGHKDEFKYQARALRPAPSRSVARAAAPRAAARASPGACTRRRAPRASRSRSRGTAA